MKPKYPKGEYVHTTYFNENKELLFIMTSKLGTKGFSLYAYVDGEFKKLGKGNNPQELENKYNVEKRMRGKS